MLITVNKDEKFIRLHFLNADNEKSWGANPIFYEQEIITLRDNHFGCVSDIGYTVKRLSDRLIVWYESKCLVDVRMNLTQFFNAILKLPLNKDIVLNTDSFNRMTFEFEPYLNVVQICTHSNFNKTAMKPFLIGAKRGCFMQLKQELSRLVTKAHIYSDGAWNGGGDFYFDGRIENGCGYNGGLIFSEYEGFKGYSIHT